MIASLHGRVEQILSTSYILNVGGVGYEVFPTAKVIFQVEIGQTLDIYIAEHIKEDHYTLFGFNSISERNLYFQLTSVSGVGPKVAMAILSEHETEQIEQAIFNGEVALFSKISGIGSKTAQRIILELKGKLVGASEPANLSDDPVYQALQSLGFSAQQIKPIFKNLPADLSADKKLKQALAELGR